MRSRMSINKMGLIGKLALLCFMSLIALEGLNPSLTAEANKNATKLLREVGKQYAFDVAQILPHLAHLRYLALSAPLILVIHFHGLFVFLYLLLTRYLLVVSKGLAIYQAVQKTGFFPVLSQSPADLSYLLLTVGLAASVLCRAFTFGSSRAK